MSPFRYATVDRTRWMCTLGTRRLLWIQNCRFGSLNEQITAPFVYGTREARAPAGGKTGIIGYTAHRIATKIIRYFNASYNVLYRSCPILNTRAKQLN